MNPLVSEIRWLWVSASIFWLAQIFPSPAKCADLAGRGSVIDGDTIEIRGERIRLFGMDAPESAQTCSVGQKQVRCGQIAALALDQKIGGRSVSCEKRDTDRYGRIVAVCRVDGKDLNQWMVKEGHAVAYRKFSTDYVEAENQARRDKRGIWAGTFDMPEEWRRGRRAAAPQRADAPTGRKCAIKGNVGSKGNRIYHMPGQADYERTIITESKGERWFCSEIEAQSAGWRRAKR